MEEVLEAPLLGPGREDGLQGGFPEALDGREAEADLGGTGDGEVQLALVDVRTEDVQAHLLAVLDVLHHVVGAARLGGEETGHELSAEVGF